VATVEGRVNGQDCRDRDVFKDHVLRARLKARFYGDGLQAPPVSSVTVAHREAIELVTAWKI